MLHKRGFTLLEILIALFIFTIISVILSHALRTAITSEAHTEKQATFLEHLQMTSLLLSRDVEQTIDRGILNTAGAKEDAFIGTTNAITFTHAGLVNPQSVLQRTTLQRTKYFIDKDQLIRETWDALDQATNSKSHQRLVLSPINGLSFEYLDQNNHFSTHWPPNGNFKNLPRAVRVTIDLPQWGRFHQLYFIPGKAFEYSQKN